VLSFALLAAVAVAVGRPGPTAPERLAWEDAGALAAPRAYATAVSLITGEILVVGGLDKDDPEITAVTSELFEPTTGRVRVLPRMLVGRVNHAAIAGAGGRVAIIGGSEWAGNGWTVSDRVDVYLPYERRWTSGRAMLQGRTGVRAATLADGRIFVTGGYDGPRLIASSEIYDPITNTWRDAAPMPSARGDFAIATLPDGRVLVAGGLEGRGSLATRTSLYYDISRDAWTSGPQLREPRVLNAQTVLPNGDVLLIGGQGASSNTAERYDARTRAFEYAGTLAVPRMVADAAALPDGRAILTGGLIVTAGPVVFDPTARTELWEPATNSWREVAPVSSGRAFARLIATADGIFQVSGVAFAERAEAAVERFVWHYAPSERQVTRPSVVAVRDKCQPSCAKHSSTDHPCPLPFLDASAHNTRREPF